jgi:tRNA A37 N6-isopentenylltransferase MiaA
MDGDEIAHEHRHCRAIAARNSSGEIYARLMSASPVAAPAQAPQNGQHPARRYHIVELCEPRAKAIEAERQNTPRELSPAK